MRQLHYYIASSLDHFIADETGDFSRFTQYGDHAEEYLRTLKDYDTVLMGRLTYEVGYAYGLEPGHNPYPWMECYVVSGSMQEENGQAIKLLAPTDVVKTVTALKATEGTAIYLCGGGALAGLLLDNGLIDKLLLKLNPIILGAGIPLFGSSERGVDARLVESKNYDSGVVLLDYDLGFVRHM